MHITIHAYDPDTRQVSVTFDYAGVTHTRCVNACHDEATGDYDPAATSERVGAVGNGVRHKIDLGVIQNLPEPEPEPVEDPEAEAGAED